jgi:hypothetical protein
MRVAQKKDMQPVREKTASFRDAVTKNISRADLKDHGGNANISIMWNLNKESIRDMVFLLEINGQKGYIDLEELLSYTRLM